MRRFITLLIVVFCLLGGLCYVWKAQSGAPKLLAEYQRIAPFSEQEMTYYSLGKTLKDKGLIFYRPSFPHLPLRLKADYMRLTATPIEIRMHLSGVVADLAQTLLARDGTDLTDTLKSFSPPESFITQPLEALVLMNHDLFKGSIEITVKPMGQKTQLTLIFSQQDTEILRFAASLDNIRKNGLWAWTDGTFKSAYLQITDPTLCSALADYYRSTGRPVLQSLEHAIIRRTPFQAVISLNAPVKVSDLLNRF